MSKKDEAQQEDQVDRGDEVVTAGDDDEARRQAEATVKAQAEGQMTDEEVQAAVEKLLGQGEDDEQIEDENEKDDEQDHMIPKSRFDQALSKKDQEMKELQAKLDELAQRIPQPRQEERTDPAKEIRDLIYENEDRYEAAIADNDLKAAKEIRRVLNEQRDELIELKISEATRTARYASSDDMKYDAYLENLEAQHPAIQQDHEDFDQGKVNELIELRDAYLARGSTQFDALKKASKYVLGEPKTSQKQVDENVESRTKAARRGALDAVKKTPALGDNARGTKGPDNALGLDPTKLSQEQFAKLPVDALAQLRGDTLE